VFTIEGTPTHPKSPPIIPIVDNIVGWLGTIGVLSALRRRAVEGGSYRVTVNLTRTVLWLMSLGIFDKAYAQATAGSSDEHAYIAPDLFTAETPLGTYQGMTDQGVLSKTPGSFRTVLVPQGSSKPEWLKDLLRGVDTLANSEVWAPPTSSTNRVTWSATASAPIGTPVVCPSSRPDQPVGLT
jgi:CoA-transferase family III